MNYTKEKQSSTIRFRRFTRKRYAAFTSIHKQVTIGHINVDICLRAQAKAKKLFREQDIRAEFQDEMVENDYSSITPASEELINCLQVCPIINKHKTEGIGDPRPRSYKAALQLLVCIAALFMFSNIIKASDSIFISSNLSEIEIIAQKSDIYTNKLRPIINLTQNDIKSLPVTSINELLDYIPGIDVRQRGTGGVQADLSLRAGTFDQVLILIDGMDITDPQTGHHNLDLPIDLASIESIEIMQGSIGSTGGSGFCGTINIITNKKQSKKARTAVSGGMYGSFNTALSGSYFIKDWSIGASVSHNQSTGYINNTDYNYTNLYLTSEYASKKLGEFKFRIGGQIKAFGSNAFYSTTYPDQFERTRTLLIGLDWSKRLGNFGIIINSNYRRHYDQFELFRDTTNAPSWYTNPNYHLTDVSGISVKGVWYSSIGKSSIGINFKDEHIFSNVLGDSLAEAKPIPFIDNTVFNLGKNRYYIRYYAEQLFLIKNFSAAIGLSGFYHSQFGNHFDFGLNTSYSFTDASKLYLNVNSATRMPTFTDLYYKSATQVSNPNLQAEKSITAEIGGSVGIKWFNASINAYYRYGKDIIDWIQFEENGKWYSMNHTVIQAAGGDIILGAKYGKYLKNLQITYTFNFLSKNTDQYVSKYALDYLKHKVNVNADINIYKGFGINLQYSYQNRNGSYYLPNGSISQYPDSHLLDGRIYWEGMGVKIYAEATNILNQIYYDYGNIPQPGIWVKAGISYLIAK